MKKRINNFYSKTFVQDYRCVKISVNDKIELLQGINVLDNIVDNDPQ